MTQMSDEEHSRIMTAALFRNYFGRKLKSSATSEDPRYNSIRCAILAAMQPIDFGHWTTLDDGERAFAMTEEQCYSYDDALDKAALAVLEAMSLGGAGGGGSFADSGPGGGSSNIIFGEPRK